MANWLPRFGIYPDAMNDAADVIDEAMLQLGFLTSEKEAVYTIADEWIKNSDMRDVTNTIISALFGAFEFYAKEEKKVPNEISCFVNCSDSHIWIDGEEVIP